MVSTVRDNVSVAIDCAVSMPSTVHATPPIVADTSPSVVTSSSVGAAPHPTADTVIVSPPPHTPSMGEAVARGRV